MAVEIARALETHLGAVGIDADLVLMREQELHRDVLINHDFEIYVARSPELRDPDDLRPLLHSSFNSDPGWLNPFGLADIDVDELLEDQRRLDGMDRRRVVYDLQRQIAKLQPFAMIGFPEDVRTARSDRFHGWFNLPLRDPLSFLTLRSREDEEIASTTLRVLITDKRVTKNFNPIAVEYRNRGTFIGLVYDSLGRRFGESVIPWMAREWTWDTSDRTTATVRLRSNLRFHDDSPLTASDVAFTYRFMSDTSLGSHESPVPAPRYRGHISLIEAVEVLDDRTLRFEFGETAPAVARRAFTVPVLPAHEWKPRAKEVNLGGITLFDGITEALVWANPQPVGSGVLRYDRSIPDELVSFTRFEEHFIDRDTVTVSDGQFGNGVPFEEMIARVAPSDAAAVELVATGEAEATVSSVDPSVVPQIGRNDDLLLLVDESRSFYHVGFNARRGVLGNSRFRRVLSGLLDSSDIASEIFNEYLEPSAVPIKDRVWTPSDLRWVGSNPEVPFIGSEGRLDDTEAKERLREAGYRYSGNGELRER